MDKMEMYWYNFDTGEYDFRTGPTTDEEAVKYLPKNPAARSLYWVYRDQGIDLSEAMVRVLQAVVGDSASREA